MLLKTPSGKITAPPPTHHAEFVQVLVARLRTHAPDYVAIPSALALAPIANRTSRPAPLVSRSARTCWTRACRHFHACVVRFNN